MIIFEYSTLACDSHRWHFIDSLLHHCKDCATWIKFEPFDKSKCPSCGKCPFDFKPDYESYYAAAKDDKPIKVVCNIYNRLYEYSDDFEIWADIPERFREQTIKWLEKSGSYDELSLCPLKMRPDGDTTPWHELKEKWLNQYVSKELGNRDQHDLNYSRFVEIAFEISGSPMIDTWKNYGVPVFEVHNAR